MVCVGMVLAQAIHAHSGTGAMAHGAAPQSRKLGGTQAKALCLGDIGYSGKMILKERARWKMVRGTGNEMKVSQESPIWAELMTLTL